MVSIPTSANQEDYVSFATTAARKCRDIINMAFEILVVELAAAAQAVELRSPLKAGKGNAETYEYVRSKVPFYADDALIYKEIEKLKKDLIQN
ncbi:aromatic amino acid lyase [bacterium]|nr:MAG: aromatic amino acid lyase [bacterium]